MTDRNRAERAVEELLRALDVPPSSELDGTPARVAEAWLEELLAGYRIDATAVLVENAIARAQGTSDLVIVRDVAITTMCPHHLMPGSGSVTIAFEPADKVVGVGAVVRAARALARRLSLQETIGQELARALMTALAPRWAACRLVMSHTCLTARGERAHGTLLETLSIAGEGDRALIARAVAS